MAHVKRFYEVNESFFHFSDYIDFELLQKVIDAMRPKGKGWQLDYSADEFKQALREFNEKYPIKEHKRLPETFGKGVAHWVDLNLVQDVIERMNPVICRDAEAYKIDLENFIKNGAY